LKNEETGIPGLKCNGKFESDNKTKASILNYQFTSVFTKEKHQLPNLPPSNTPAMPHLNISTNGITKLLKDLNPHKASGPDGIPARILKLAAEEIAPALTIICQKSLESGQIPSQQP